jgi:hypothetical protein
MRLARVILFVRRSARGAVAVVLASLIAPPRGGDR